MEPLFELSADDLSGLLPHMKIKLMSGTESAQMCVAEEIAMLLKRTNEGRGLVVRKLVKFNVVSTICNLVQTAEEDFVRVALECFELMSNHEEFYEDYTAVCATESMLRLCYHINKSLTRSRLLEELAQGICNVLVRSSKFTANFESVCVPQQVVSFLKNLDIQDSSRNKLRFTAVAMLNAVLQRAVFTEDDADLSKMVIDVCRNALKSMADIVNENDEDDTISRAVALLCGTCDGASRFCKVDEDNQIDAKLDVCQMRADLSDCVYDATMSVIVPHVKDADLSRVDPIEFHRSLISCLNNLYQLRNCNHDDLSNHLAANGYLKYFLQLTVRLPENLRRSICALLSRILSILSKTALCTDTIMFANTLHQGLLQLPKDSKRWDDAVAHREEAGTALVILLYYHYHGTRENDTISLKSLVVRIMSLRKSTSISVPILKPLWFLFAVTSLSHPRPYLIPNCTNAITHLTSVLQHLELSEFYTHHIDLLRHCLKCSEDISQNFLNQVLDLWLIESDGDVKPLMPFGHDKMVRRLLILLQAGYSENIINLATKALRQVIQVYKDDKRQIEKIAEIVWNMLPNILLLRDNTVTHIEAVLELANITQPHTIPIHLITRTTDIIVNIILKENTDTKFMTLILTQAYILLVVAAERKSFKVLTMYTEKPQLLKKLCAFGFAEEFSPLCTISIKLLIFIIHCQKETSIKCKQPLIINMKNLVELLWSAKTSPCRLISALQLVLELLTQKRDSLSASIVLQNFNDAKIRVDVLINLYEVLHMVLYIERDSTGIDLVYQCLTAVLNFSKTKVITLLPHLCTVMSNYNLVSNGIKMRYVSCHFVEFIVTWLRCRKAFCKDVPCNARSLFKSPFDKVLDQLKDYSVLMENNGSKDAYLSSLQEALSQFSSEQ